MTDETRISRTQWLVLAAAFLGWMFDGVEIGLFPLVARPALTELLQVSNDAAFGRWIGVFNFSFLIGAACGGLVFGWLGDRIGRVRAMIISVLAYSIFTGAGYFATHPWQLGVFRFIAALGMGGEWAVAVALVMECWPERHRPKLAGAIGAAANVGFLMIAVIAYFKPVTPDSWRWIMLVGAAPAFLALFITLYVPESEKWKHSRQGAKQTPVIEIFSGHLRNRTLLAIVLSGIPLIGTWAAISGWVPSWTEQIRENQAKRAVLAATMPDVQTDTGADLTPQQDDRYKELAATMPDAERKAINNQAAKAKARSQMLMAIGAIIACYLAPIVGGWWGRRPTYFMLCLLSLAICAYLFRALDTFDLQFQIVLLLTGGLTAAFYGWLPLYLPELFPTRVRATGQGLAFNFGRVLAAIGTFFMGELVRSLGGYASAGATITLIYAAGLVLIWFGPETKGRPLPD